MIAQADTLPYQLIEFVNMPESINQTISLFFSTQTIYKRPQNIEIIQNSIEEEEEDFQLKSYHRKIKVKMNITKISNHVPKLSFDEYDDMEE